MAEPTAASSVVDFVKDTAERAAKTAAQVLVAFLVVDHPDIRHVDWPTAGSIAAGAAIVSVLTSMASAPLGQGGTASLTGAVVPTSLYRRTQRQLAAVYGRHSAPPQPSPEPAQESPRMTYRFGRKPNSGKPRITLTADLVPELQPPAKVDWYTKVPADSWGMDGNDAIGDCTCAEVDHGVKTLQVAAGNPETKSTAAEVIALYSAVTGYTPADPNSDQGAEMQDVRNYWRKTGVTLGGVNDQILLFAEVDRADHNLVKWCIAHFGELGVGINFPSSAMQQFNSGLSWDVVQKSPIEGGHAIGAVGYDDTYVYVVTWGQVQKMTWRFWDAYVEEVWTQLSTDFVNSVSGDDPLGETLYGLGQQYASITGQANPIPAPAPQPSPAPTPEPSPAPVPSPAPSGFPLDAWDAFAAHPYSRPKERSAIAAVNAWLAGGGA